MLSEQISEFVGLRVGDGGGGQQLSAQQGQGSPASLATTNVVDEIREQWRRRQAWHRAEKALTLQAKALCRRLVEGDRKAADALYGAAMGKGSHPLPAAAGDGRPVSRALPGHLTGCTAGKETAGCSKPLAAMARREGVRGTVRAVVTPITAQQVRLRPAAFAS